MIVWIRENPETGTDECQVYQDEQAMTKHLRACGEIEPTETLIFGTWNGSLTATTSINSIDIDGYGCRPTPDMVLQ